MQMFGTVGPMARHAEDLDVLLAVLSERRLPPAAVERVAVFEDNGLQPVSRACRQAVKVAAAALADARIDVVEGQPPYAGDLRVAYDTILAHEMSAALSPLLDGREAEVMPYIAEIAEAGRDFQPSFDALGLPTLALPVNLSDTGLPVGVQLIGRRGEERTLIALARLLEHALGGWLDPDAPTTGSEAATTA
jgi:Asp-tRNA(Asn)/Glu-tRNA(Gln) amidotransferase A subunit family amidase